MLPSRLGERQKTISSYGKTTQRKRVFPRHSQFCQCVKKCNTIFASKTESELEVENWRLTKTLTKRDKPDNFSCVTPRKRLPNVEENDYHSNEKFEYK